MDVVVKQCSKCKKLGIGPKALSEFNKKSTTPDGFQHLCREHTQAYCRSWAKKFPEKNRAKGKRYRGENPIEYRKIWVRGNLKRCYGISEAQYTEMFDSQNGRCALCSMQLVSQLDHSRPMLGQPAENIGRVDHCHKTKKVRGILCFGCNVGLGKFHDSITELKLAIRYLEATQTEPVA